jgi:hypothetical protein
MTAQTDGLARYRRALSDGRVWRRTFALGLPVGFAQAMLNQGDHWLNHHVDAVVITKSILSPVLACTIALISALTATAAKNSNP